MLDRFNLAYRFIPTVSLDAAEDALHLSLVAAEGLFGESVVRLDFRYERDDARHALLLDSSTDAGRVVAQVFTALLNRELGPTAYFLADGGVVEEHSAVAASA